MPSLSWTSLSKPQQNKTLKNDKNLKAFTKLNKDIFSQMHFISLVSNISYLIPVQKTTLVLPLNQADSAWKILLKKKINSKKISIVKRTRWNEMRNKLPRWNYVKILNIHSFSPIQKFRWYFLNCKALLLFFPLLW